MKKREIISVVLSAVIFIQGIGIRASAKEREIVLPENQFPEINISELLNYEGEDEETAEEKIEELFENAQGYEEYISVLKEKRNEIEPLFEEYKTELLRKTGISEEEYAEILGESIDRTDAVITALYVKNTELTKEDFEGMKEEGMTKFSRYDALDMYFYLKEVVEEERAAEIKGMLVRGYEAYSLIVSVYLSAAFEVKPSETGVYRNYTECMEKQNSEEPDEWEKEGLRLCADGDILRELSNNNISIIKGIEIDTSMLATGDENLPNLTYGEVSAPYTIQNSITESVDIAHQGLKVDYDIVNMTTYGGLPFGLTLHYDSSNSKYNEYRYKVNYSSTSSPYPYAAPAISFSEKVLDAGAGWTWKIPYIEKINIERLASRKSSYLAIHMPDGAVYYTDSNYKLQNNNMYNYTFYKDRTDFSNGEESSYFLLTEQTTRINYYFDKAGQLIGLNDMYGNSVKYRYESASEWSRLKEIEDDLGRKVTVDYSSDAGIITVTAPDGKKTLIFSSGEELMSIQNPEQKITKFTYEKIDCESLMEYKSGSVTKKTGAYKSCYAALTTITYPTLAASVYSYYTADEAAWQSLPYETDLGYKEKWTSLKLENRLDYIGFYEYNNISYSGALDSAIEYGVNVSQNGVVDRYRFNEYKYCYIEEHYDTIGKNSIKKRVEFVQREKVSDDDIYRTYPLPSKVTTTTSTDNSTKSRILTEEYEYSMESGAFGRIKSKSVGTRKTEYIYPTQKFTDPRTGEKYLLWSPSEERAYMDKSSYIAATYEYDANTAALIKAVSGKVSGSGCDERLGVLTYEYDDKGNLTDSKIYERKNANDILMSHVSYNFAYGDKVTPYLASKTAYNSNSSVTTLYSYNLTNGLLESYTDPNGNKTSYTYDVMNRILSEKYADNSVSSVSYAFEAIEVPTVDDPKTEYNQTVVYTDPTGVKNKITYDPLGKEINRSMYHGGEWISVLTKAYNSKNLVTDVTDAAGNKTSYEYDDFGRLTKTTNPDGTFAICMYADGPGLESYISEENVVNGKYYNELGELASVACTERNGNSYSFVPLENYYYDNFGRLYKTHSVLGTITKNTYDSQGNKIKHERYVGSVSSEVPEVGVEKYFYEYDILGNLERTIDINNNTTQNIYNMLGQVTQKIDGMNYKEYYEYDNAGNVTKKTDRNGTVFTNTYDVRNRLTKTSASSSTLGSASKTWVYDKAGRVLKITGTNLLGVSYTYDDAGRLSGVKRNGRTLNYEYDNNSNVTSVNDYFGNVTEYGYNSRNQVISAGNTSLVYNKDGSLKEQITGIYTQSYTYNDRGLPDSLKITGENDILLYSEANEYDTYGNRTKTDYVFGEISGNTIRGGFEYYYDNFGRLDYETLKKPTSSGEPQVDLVPEIAMDFAGNIIGIDLTDDKTPYTIDGNNRMRASEDEDGNETIYTYDRNGNLLSKTHPDGSEETYTYDIWGNMIKYQPPKMGYNPTNYTYYADGLRAAKGIHYYYYDRDMVINESYRNYSMCNTVIGSRIVYREDEYLGVNMVYGYNTHGDVALVLDENGGDPLQAYTYEAYGNIYDDMSGFYERNYNGYDKYLLNNPIRYAGQYWDSESGMYYMRARYYDPGMMRFTQEDPVRSGMNWYAYCAGNPVMYTDPLGLAAVSIRSFASTYNGITTWDSKSSIATFTIAGTTITTSSTGHNSHGLTIWNENGSMMADDSALYAFFGAKKSSGRGYSNTTFYNADKDTYEITTNLTKGNLTYHYYVKGGALKFDFTKNNYWNILLLGGGKKLSEAMYSATTSISSNYLSGRTIGGINTELQLHWAAYTLGIKRDSAKVADIGGMNKNKPGYDSNAWFFQTAQAGKIVGKLNIFAPMGIVDAIKEISEYI